MKKLLLVALLAIGASATSYAQMPSPAEQLAQLKTSLSLTDAQVTKLTPVYNARGKSIDSLIAAANGDFSSMREKFTPIIAKYDAQIAAVLTPTQAAAYKKQQEEMRARMGQN